MTTFFKKKYLILINVPCYKVKEETDYNINLKQLTGYRQYDWNTKQYSIHLIQYTITIFNTLYFINIIIIY